MTAPAVAWFEVTGSNGANLQKFYGQLFDWAIQDAGDASDYGIVGAAPGGIGGGIGTAQDGAGRVTFYVEVDDPDAYLHRVQELGGTIVMPATQLDQFGLTFAFFADPEGNIVGLSKGAVQ